MANDVIVYQEMIDEIKEIMSAARDNVAREVNSELLLSKLENFVSSVSKWCRECRSSGGVGFTV